MKVEGKVFWTLSSDHFQSSFVKVPDLTRTRLLIFVRPFDKLCANLDLFHSSDLPDLKGQAALGIMGSVVRFVHEIVHAGRWQKSLSDTFRWKLLDCGWCLSLEDMKKSATTPEKFVGYRYGSKRESEFPADAGRLWEHSLTLGDAVIEGDLVLLAVTVSNQGNARCSSSNPLEEILSEATTVKESLAIIADPTQLLKVTRAHAEALRAKCPPGYTIMQNVACSCSLIGYAQDGIRLPHAPWIRSLTFGLRPRFQVFVSVPGLGGLDPQELRSADPGLGVSEQCPARPTTLTPRKGRPPFPPTGNRGQRLSPPPAGSCDSEADTAVGPLRCEIEFGNPKGSEPQRVTFGNREMRFCPGWQRTRRRPPFQPRPFFEDFLFLD